MRPEVPKIWMLLIGHHLRAAGAGRVSRAVVEEDRGQPIRVHIGITLDGSRDAQGLAPEDESGRVDEVTADVHQRAAAELRAVADVRRVAIRVAERAQHRSHLTDAAAGHQFLDRQPLRVRAHHERFLDFDAGAIAGRDELTGLIRRERDRLLAKHVLAALGCVDRPGHVQVIRQRIVDGLDIFVDEQLLVGPVGFRDPQFRRRGARLLDIPRRDGSHLRPLAALHGRDDLVGRDFRDAEHAPTNLAHWHWW